MAYYLTLMVNRHEAGAHVLRGGQKWLVPANWKIIAENVVGDLYHVSSLHESSVAVGFRAPMGNKGYEIHLDNGHGLGAEFGGTMQSENDQPIYAEYLNQVKDQVEQRHGKAARDIVPVGTSLVFPNLFVFDSMRFRLLWAIHPRGPEMTEIHSWSLVDNALPHEMKEEVGKQAALALGMFLVDDEDCWKEVMAGLRGVVGRRHPSNYQMGLGRDRAAADMFPGSGFPGKMAERFPDEGNQRNFYSCWQSLINGE